ncbi:MAG: AMP-binding protein [Chitinophagales bacterium]|nr:AMP-binding protein [Chitinophagales bacterium]MDW8418323.1 AMP-binding protein [Chitinophagales bacterium]
MQSFISVPCHQLAQAQLHALAKENLLNVTEEWQRACWNLILHFTDPQQHSITFTTSGSTGAPKVISISKTHITRSARETIAFLNIKENINTLCCLPVDKIGGAMVVLRAIVCRLQLIVVKPSLNPFLCELPVKIHLTSLTPMQLNATLQDVRTSHIPAGIHTVLLGGSDVPRTLLDKIAGFSNRIYATYGMTETISHIALRRLTAPAQEYYVPLPGVRCLLNEHKCLVIDAPHLGVHNLNTRDVAELRDDGSFKWIGRLDLVINSGGVKIHPEILEEKLQPLIPYPFFVGGVSDDVSGERPVLFVETDEGVHEDMMRGWYTFMNKNFTKYEVPVKIVFVREFVRTPTGKINRKATINKLQEMNEL